MSKLERIMEEVCSICHFAKLGCIGPTCESKDNISAILSSPDIIEVDGVEWVPIEFEHGDYFVGKAGADGWAWGNMTDVNPDRSAISHYAPTAESALRAATAAIKEAANDKG